MLARLDSDQIAFYGLVLTVSLAIVGFTVFSTVKLHYTHTCEELSSE